MSDAPDLQEVRRQAAAWLVRLRNASVDQADLAAFREWRTTPAHEAAFQEMEGLWRQTGSLAEDPDVIRAVEEARRRKEPVRRVVLAAGGIGGLVALCALIWVMQPTTFATGVGQSQVVHLADGTQVRLDTNSRIRVRISKAERAVDLLQGQAFFDVTHDAARPFQVTSGSVTIRDIGTRFSVRRADAASATVVLVQGSVEVRAPTAKPLTLSPGQAVNTASPLPPQTVDLAAATSWTQGRLSFHNTPLSTAIAEANRYAKAPIVLEGTPDLPAMAVDGTFVASDTAAFVAALCDLYGLQAHPRGDGAIVLSPKTAAGA